MLDVLCKLLGIREDQAEELLRLAGDHLQAERKRLGLMDCTSEERNFLDQVHAGAFAEAAYQAYRERVNPSSVLDSGFMTLEFTNEEFAERYHMFTPADREKVVANWFPGGIKPDTLKLAIKELVAASDSLEKLALAAEMVRGWSVGGEMGVATEPTMPLEDDLVSNIIANRGFYKFARSELIREMAR